MPNEDINYIFEASWEVCNKVGGIYTVLSTKAKTLQKLHKDQVIFIGRMYGPKSALHSILKNQKQYSRNGVKQRCFPKAWPYV